MKSLMKEILVAVVVAMAIMQFIKPTVVKAESMQPTLYENNYLLLNRQAYNFGEPHRGDIIVFHTDLKLANGEEKMLIKRVIGLPGETICIAGGKVYINDELLVEDYTKDGYTNGFIINMVIPEGELFVMGDNRLKSGDSREARIGCVKIDDILGKAFIRLYPFDCITVFE